MSEDAKEVNEGEEAEEGQAKAEEKSDAEDMDNYRCKHYRRKCQFVVSIYALEWMVLVSKIGLTH